MEDLINLYCQDFTFDPKLSVNRTEKAEVVFGKKVLINVLCPCLYLLGVKRVMIATAQDYTDRATIK